MKITKTGISNFAKAVGRVAERAAAGESLLVDSSTKNKRLSLCQSCEYLDGMQCAVCECLVRAKTMLASETCPKNKW